MNRDIEKGWRAVGALVAGAYAFLFLAGIILDALNAGAL